MGIAVLSIVMIVATAIVVVTAGAVPRGTEVLGVEIGGRSTTAAADTLRAALRARAEAPVQLRAGSKTFEVSPADLGLRVDAEATARRAAEQRVNPLAVLFGSTEVEPVVRVAKAKIPPAVAEHIADQRRDMERPAIRFEGSGANLKPVASYGKPGRGVDPTVAAQVLSRQWLRQRTIELPIGPIPPQDSAADVDTLVSSLAAPAIAASVRVETPEGAVDLTPGTIAAGLVLEADETGHINPTIDTAKLREAAGDALGKFGTPAKDGKITIERGQPTVVPSEMGRGLDLDKLAKPLLTTLREPAPRTLSGEMGPLSPKLSTEKLNSLGVTTQISTFTTNFTGGQERNKNILLVADEVDNALVLPGDEFALNEYTGERGPDQGYVKAPVILGGKIKNEYGGGISQFATTLYNAVFFSGLEDVFHKAHGYYISRYPAGREATVYYPSLDLKFRNDTAHGVVIDTSYTDTSITVSFWSTKRYDIESVSEEPTNSRPIETVYLENEPDCYPTEGILGFDIVVWRIFKQNGAEVKRERIFTKYDAEPKFICGPKP